MVLLSLHVFLGIVLAAFSLCESANILYIVPFSSMSHYIMLKPIGTELARRGHNVTVITAHKENHHPPNYRQVMVDDKQIWDVIGGDRPNVFDMVQISTEKFFDLILWGGGKAITEMALNSTEIQKFFAEDNKFDVVISEQFFQEAFIILAHKYNAPLILVTTFGNCMRHNIATRNPLQLATVVSEFLYVKEPTSFFARFRNLYFTVYEYLWWRYWFLEENEKLVKKYIPNLPEPVPGLYEVQRDAAMLLVNGHFSFDTPVAYLPNIVEIGGVHLSRSNETLPGHLQKILDAATEGVVYVSFGSNVKSSELPVEKKNAFLEVFKTLKQTVIWKWEDDNLIDIPDNLVVRKWLPQKEILAHPNIRLFLSHGGLIGTQEAVYNGVPIVGIPIYADQYNNLLQAEHHGFGKILEFKDINEESLGKVLNEVLTNESYKIKAKEVSYRFKDRPMTPLDTAMFWIEYVIRHKGANYMKNPAIELNWVASNMLDVYVIIFIAFLGVVFIALVLIGVAMEVCKNYIFIAKISKNEVGKKKNR